jgi:hypothetical protein
MENPMTSISHKICKAVRRDRTYVEKLLFKQKAWRKGRNPWLTVPNLNTSEKAKRFIRVRANEVWGDPRKGFMLSTAKVEV